MKCETIKFKKQPKIIGAYSIVGPKEGQGNFKDYFDYIMKNDLFGEKTYEISLTNMPEFLDYNPQIKVIHVNVDSPYGWNVFFENGTFMNLMDLKEFQERNGYLPGTNGKIIYGNKTTTFEQIEKIVVYEKPRYIFYNIANK